MIIQSGKIVTLLALMFVVSSCDQIPIPPANAPPVPVKPVQGTVVVLDLNVIAAAVGEDLNFKEQVAKANSSLTQQLNQIAGELNKQLETQKGKFGPTPSDEEREQLVRMTNQAQSELRKKQQEARQRGQQYQASLRQKFVESLQPLAAKIAQQRNADAVIFRNASLIWASDKVDITQEVITALKAKRKNEAALANKADAKPSAPVTPAAETN